MRTFVWLVAFVTLLAGWTGVASAQNITLGTAPDREDNDYDGELEYYISRADCDQDEVFTFSYTATLTGVSSLQVWVGEGADCSLIDEREGVDAGCLPVRTIDTPDQNDTVDLTAAEIAGAHKTITGCDDSSAPTDPHQTEIFFLLIRGSGTDVDAADYATWTGSKVDLLGPRAPVVNEVSAADESVTIDIELNGDAGDQYQAFCNPKPTGATEPQSRPFGGATGGGGAGGGGAAAGGGGAAAGGAGGAAAGGGGASAGGAGEGGAGGSVPAPDCDAGDLLSGQIPPASAACGELLAGPGVTITGLDNGTEYAIGIAAVDELGNYGELSEIVCVSPVAVEDFFDNYRNAGGQGGCIGGCAVSEAPLSMSAVVGAVALFALALRRRRAGKALGKLAGPLALALAFTYTSPASAQSGIPDSNWRQFDRPPREPADTQFAFEVRFGPYWPQVDSEDGLSGTPYESTFGNDGRFYFGLEFDWMPLRIPYVGTFGVGVGWGYTWASANALRSGVRSDDRAGPGGDQRGRRGSRPVRDDRRHLARDLSHARLGRVARRRADAPHGGPPRSVWEVRLRLGLLEVRQDRRRELDPRGTRQRPRRRSLRRGRDDRPARRLGPRARAQLARHALGRVAA
jgi:hypothetical protein